MTYYELIENIRDLGFGEDVEIAEFENEDVQVVTNAINRAITKINISDAQINGTYDFNPYEIHKSAVIAEMEAEGIEIADDESNVEVPSGVLLEVYMPDIDEQFMAFGTMPVKRELANGIFEKFNDYDIENDDTIIISADLNNTFRVYYLKAHTKVGSDVIDETSEIAQTQLPIPLKAHHLVPLLASYFVWLDDDPSKATQYYNLYEQMRAELAGLTQRVRGKIMSGGI